MTHEDNITQYDSNKQYFIKLTVSIWQQDSERNDFAKPSTFLCNYHWDLSLVQRFTVTRKSSTSKSLSTKHA